MEPGHLRATPAEGQTTRLGSFEILRKLARGGMAELFLARTVGPSGFEKLVVLKKILPKYAAHPRFVQQFLDEAKLAATLDHPSIAQVHDIGMVDGAYFFTMEFVHGQDARTILHRTWRRGERMPIEDTVQIARQVAGALHHAHEKRRPDGTLLGIVHRDVSPSNVLVSYDGAVKLVDFGVAKTAASSTKTRTGALKGKIAYMSPEQARGQAIDRRSDVFSLGILLWEMVATQRLFRADNDLATLQAVITEPARPPTTLRADCPPELERIVMRALEKDPESRYPTAQAMLLDLEELAREQRMSQSPVQLAARMRELFAVEIATAKAMAQGFDEKTRPVSESDIVPADHGEERTQLLADDELFEAEEEEEPDLDDDLDERDTMIAGAPLNLPRGTSPHLLDEAVPFAPRHTPPPWPVAGSSPSLSSPAIAPPPPMQARPRWVVELPEIDPAVFERQKRIVVRAGAVLLGVLVLIGLIVGGRGRPASVRAPSAPGPTIVAPVTPAAK